MIDYRLAEMELKFVELIWQHEPINSTELVRLSEKVMKWKKSTTYTILKRLCDRGILNNDDAIVTAAISRDDFFAGQSRRFVEDSFGGSLPQFLTSFISGKKLSDQQAEELIRLIHEHKED